MVSFLSSFSLRAKASFSVRKYLCQEDSTYSGVKSFFWSEC